MCIYFSALRPTRRVGGGISYIIRRHISYLPPLPPAAGLDAAVPDDDEDAEETLSCADAEPVSVAPLLSPLSPPAAAAAAAAPAPPASLLLPPPACEDDVPEVAVTVGWPSSWDSVLTNRFFSSLNCSSS